MRIRLNGEPHDLAAPLTVAALLERLGIDSRRVAVEHNLTVVKRVDYDTTMVGEEDEVEIVNFVGGGSCASARIRNDASKQRAERERGVAGAAGGAPARQKDGHP